MVYVEMMTIYVIIRTLLGITFLKAATVAEEIMTTKVTPSPIAIAFSTLLVTANEEQIPNTATATGFCRDIPSRMMLNHLVYFILMSFIITLPP